ncbi:carbohydrate-binding-like protein [Dunaliella salina]|uniref:Carbohydrate-binding-like protein n=1 Tax=Dunaliella salina TaxID=3046 RepID=A0ABQ7H884_DUNSA|nr:carbohydrate-binding-like protein [Dunaliella salina]|eukprot:KAF5843061.1 carbohydrate-binding-like protein [Dunaliella salina]
MDMKTSVGYSNTASSSHTTSSHHVVAPPLVRSSRRYAGRVNRTRPGRQRPMCMAQQSEDEYEDQGEIAANVNLRIPYHVDFGQCLAIVGSGEHLGNWNPGSAIKMTWTEGDYWVAELQLKTLSETELEYKYLVLNSDGNLGLWKPGSNFRLEIPPGARVKVHEHWVEDLGDGPRHVEVDKCSLQKEKASDKHLLGAGPTKSAIELQTDTAMEELEYALEQQCTSLDKAKDPASTELINGDRILAAASNKAMAFKKAAKASEVLPQLPGTNGGEASRLRGRSSQSRLSG